MNKKFYLAGALAVAMSMATPQFAFAVNPGKTGYTMVKKAGEQLIVAVDGVKYSIWSITGEYELRAFVVGFTGSEVTIPEVVDLGLVGNAVVVGFDTTNPWTDADKATVEKITLNNKNITSIETNLFAGFTSLEAVYVGSYVNTIGAGAFAGCTSLSSFGVDETSKGKCCVWGTLKIDNGAFEGAAFTKIHVEEGANCTFGTKMNPWKGCNALTTIESESANFCVVDNMLVKGTGTKAQVITYALGAAAVKTVTIPENASVLPYAFANVNKITTLNVGVGVKPAANAFDSTNAGTVVVKGTIADMSVFQKALGTTENSKVTALTIEDLQLSADKYLTAANFAKLPKLATLTIKSKKVGVDGVTPENFVLDATETSIPEVKTLALDNIKVNGKLCDGTALTKLTLTNSELAACPIEKGTDETKGILTVTIDNTKTAGCLQDCKSIKSAVVKNIAEVKGVVTAETNLFNGCSNLATVTLNGINAIGASAFAGTTALTSINLAGVTNIGANAFQNSGLTSVDLAGVTTLGASAFFGCASLETVTNCNAVTIPVSLFANCTALTDITLNGGTDAEDKVIGLTSFAAGALNGCSALKSVNIEFKDAKAKNSVIGLAKSTTSLFSGCSVLESLTLKNANMTAAYPICPSATLKTLTFDNVTYVAKNVTGIAAEDGLALTIKNGDVVASSFKDAKLVSLTLDEIGTINASAFEGVNLTAEYKNVGTLGGATTIGYAAFKGSNITAVTLTNATTIGDEAFAKTALASVNLTVEEGKSVTLGNNIFSGCENLVEASLENVDLVIPTDGTDPAKAKEIFKGCTAIETLTLNKVNFLVAEFKPLPIKNLTATNLTLPEYDNGGVFEGNATIETVELTGSVIPEASAQIFAGCPNLTTVKGLSSEIVPNHAFHNSPKLESVTLAEGVKTINYCAFEGTALKEITLPASVEKIEAGAFDIDSLATVNVLGATNKIELGTTAYETGHPATVFKAKEVNIINGSVVDVVTFAGTEEVNVREDGREIDRYLHPIALNVPTDILEEYKKKDGSEWINFYTLPITENNQKTIAFGSDYTNAVDSKVSKLTYTRELARDGWFDWYEPFDVTVGELAAKGIEVAQIYSVMPSVNKDDNSIGDRDQNLLCYVITNEDRVVKHNTPYMIRKSGMEGNTLSLEFSAGEVSEATAVYKDGKHIGYTISGTDGDSKLITLFAAANNSLDASSLRSSYTFQGYYGTGRKNVWSDAATGLLTYVFTSNPDMPMTLAHEKDKGGNNILGHRWYLQVQNNNAYSSTDPYNNISKPSEAAPRFHIIETYEQQGESTGISVIENTVAKNLKGIYTLDGKKVQSLENMPAGVYIVNGKAVYKK